MSALISIAIGVSVITVFLPLLFNYFDFTGLQIPFIIYYTIYNYLDSFLHPLYFFLPVDFILVCLSFLFIVRFSDIILNIISYIIDKVSAK